MTRTDLAWPSRVVAGSTIAAVGLALAGCSGTESGSDDQVVGSGTTASDSRTVGGFTKVQAEGAVDLVVTTGPLAQAEIEADDNILELVSTTVEGDTLVVTTTKSYSTRNPVTVTAQVPKLTGGTTSGSGDLRLTVSDAATVDVATSGSGDIVVDGTAGSAVLTTEGSGNVDASGLDADEIKAGTAGSGDIEVGSPAALDATSAGSGDIVYAQRPATLTENASGSGEIGPG
ncbi:MAG: head GIN domain-containing protein [Dermatophilaceae bacterium]